MSTLDKVAKAKSRLVLRHPFFASLLLGMDCVERPTLNPPTMATDGKCIYMHPQFVEDCTIEEVVGVLAHEVMHVAMLHPWRREHRLPRKANRAMDYAINGIIEDCGLQLPKFRLREARYDGRSFEDIYNHLPPDDPNGGGGQDGPLDNVMDAPGTEGERQQAEAEAKVRVKQAANSAKAQGALPAALESLIDDILAPKVDWKDELRRYMTAISKSDQSWARGQRRFLAQGMYLPSNHTPAIQRVVVGIDTSGSVFGRAKDFLAEVQAICEDTRAEAVTMIECDAQVQRVTEYQQGDTFVAQCVGGGGTDLRKMFDEVSTVPDVMVIFTDLETPFPTTPPEYPVLWVSTEKHVAPFGTTIYM